MISGRNEHITLLGVDSRSIQISFTYYTLVMGRDLEILPLGVWEEGKQSIRLMATLETGESDCDSVSPHKVFLAPYIYS